MQKKAASPPLIAEDSASLEIGLSAAIVSILNHQPQILVVRSPQKEESKSPHHTLPFGPFSPLHHQTLDIGLRAWVKEQTGLDLGYAEQLYTFADRGRHAERDVRGIHVVSIGYLALTPPLAERDMPGGLWQDWYHYFPWEDWRNGKPEILKQEIEPRLMAWAAEPISPLEPGRTLERQDRIQICFGSDGRGWDDEKVLERYELLYEAGLVHEARRDGLKAAEKWDKLQRIGRPMHYDHRRILATAMGRLRAKIKYRPLIFELVTEDFTLFDLQKTVEAISGSILHKQNFRRLVENAGLVEPTGELSTQTGGRPAKLFRFRRDVLKERPAPGVRVSPARI